MASPNACGGIALLLSGAKAAGASPSPARVQRAIENTAIPISGCDGAASPLTHGRGLLQVDAAFDYLMRELQSADTCPDARYAVAVRRSDGGPRTRGLYLREPSDSAADISATVSVTPVLHEDADVQGERLAVEDRLEVVPSAPWVSAPPALLLPHNGRTFDVHVHAASLPPGLHYAEVELRDARAPWRGALARVPVTVVKPQPAEAGGAAGVISLGSLTFAPGTEARRFVAAPPGATWCVLRARAGPGPPPRGFMLRLTQVRW